jgi:hypothetical protein
MLSVERVRFFDEHVGVEQFLRMLIGIGCGRFGTAEVNRLLVAHNDRVNRRVLPRSRTLEIRMVAGACDHPNCLVLAFGLELVGLVA